MNLKGTQALPPPETLLRQSHSESEILPQPPSTSPSISSAGDVWSAQLLVNKSNSQYK